jgi:hypothetical protein
VKNIDPPVTTNVLSSTQNYRRAYIEYCDSISEDTVVPRRQWRGWLDSVGNLADRLAPGGIMTLGSE